MLAFLLMSFLAFKVYSGLQKKLNLLHQADLPWQFLSLFTLPRDPATIPSTLQHLGNKQKYLVGLSKEGLCLWEF